MNRMNLDDNHRPTTITIALQFKALIILLFLMLIAATLTPAYAAGYPRQATLETRDTELRINQWVVRTEGPLVWMEGQPYGPVLELVPFLNIGARYDFQENFLQLSTDGLIHQEGTSHWAGEAARLAYEKAGLEQLKLELEQVLATPATTGEGNAGYFPVEVASVTELEEVLNDVFDVIRGIPIDIDARRAGTRGVSLTLTIDEDDRSEYQRIPRSTVTAYIEDVITAVTLLYPRIEEVNGYLQSENGTTRRLVNFELEAEDVWPAVSFRYTPSGSSNRDDDEDDWQDRWRELEEAVVRETTLSGGASSLQPSAAPQPAAPEVFRQDARITVYPLRLWVDGVPFRSQEELFVWQNTAYVPLGELADALYLTLTPYPGENALVLGSNPATVSHTFPTMLLQLEEDRKTIAQLQEEVAELEVLAAQRDDRAPVSIPYRRITTLSGMERYLRDYYEDIEGVETSLRLSRIDDNEYRLRISYDTDDFQWFDGLSRLQVQRWVEDMLAAVRELYDNEAVLEGWIRSYPYDSDEFTYITFEPRSYSDLAPGLRFDFDEHGGSTTGPQWVEIPALLRHVRRELRRFDGINYAYEAELIRRDVELQVITGESRFTDLTPERQRDYLLELQEVLEELYPGIRVDGYLTATQNGLPFYRFAIDRGEMRSISLMEALEKDFQRYDARYDDLRFTFRLRENIDGSVRVRLEGEFFAAESSWRNVDREAFDGWVEDVLQRANDVLHRPVLGEVVDRQNEALLVKAVGFPDTPEE